jgi:hypothetical protein
MRDEGSSLTIDAYGDSVWRNKRGKLHRLDGPAIEATDGYKAWYQNGEFHRIEGPAIEYSDGTKYWYQNGMRHRLDGPAYDGFNGKKYWYIMGKMFHTKEAFFDALTDEEKIIALFSEDFHNG